MSSPTGSRTSSAMTNREALIQRAEAFLQASIACEKFEPGGRPEQCDRCGGEYVTHLVRDLLSLLTGSQGGWQPIETAAPEIGRMGGCAR